MSRWPAVIGLCLLTVACGKKGPPLAPIVRIPAAVEEIAARRFADEVYVTLAVPQQNIDASMPADITRIDVYGYTGRVSPPRARFADLGTRVASIPIVPAPPPDAVDPPPPDPSAGGIQGTPVTIVDTLTSGELEQGRVDPVIARRSAPALPPVVATAAAAQPLRRFYMAFPFGPRNRPGAPGTAAELTLTEPLLPPTDLEIAQSAAGVSLTWEPIGGVVAYLIERRELPREELPYIDEATRLAAAAASTPFVVAGTAIAPLPPGPTRYNVYREVAPDPMVLPGPADPRVPWRATVPMPVAPALAGLSFAEPVEFERERCYTVRAERGVAPASVVSEPTPRVCVRPIDVYPPLPPPPPAAVATEGAISLIWEPSLDPDIGGYVVLRGEAGDATLAPLTLSPVVEASFRDTTVTPGTRYVYAVQAVDDRVPLGNVSAPSVPVEETAR